MAPCPERGVALFLNIAVANSSGEEARRRVFFSVEMGEGRVMVSDYKKEGKRGEKIELQYVFQRH